MARYMIAEDEPLAAEELSRMMREVRPEWTLSGRAESVEQAVRLLRQERFDLLVLDIQLSDGLSFEIFEEVKTDVPVIFTTAYDEYALKAFKVNSVDYLLKPIDANELLAAIEKFERRLALNPKEEAFWRLQESFAAGRGKSRFLVRVGDAYFRVETADIAYFYSEEKYTRLVTHKGRDYIVDLTLDKVAETLDARQFFRASRNCVASVKSVVKCSKWFSGRLKLELLPKCPVEVYVSREKAKDFLLWLDDAR